MERADRFYEGVLGLKKIKSGTLDRVFGEQLFDISQECEMILYGNEDFRIEVRSGFNGKTYPQGRLSDCFHRGL
jgi:catechol 2,3-dioxygenase-like lactoylglutathione lyase family enzyme